MRGMMILGTLKVAATGPMTGACAVRPWAVRRRQPTAAGGMSRRQIAIEFASSDGFNVSVLPKSVGVPRFGRDRSEISHG